MTYRIPLVRDTVSESDISNLIKWLQTNPRLTKGENTIEFEREWSRWNGNKHSIFVSSGSAANLAAYYAMIVSGRMKNKKVIVPAVSWSTTVAPAIQLGLEPILCDCNMKNLGLDIDHLNELVKLHDPALIVTVNVLGFSNDYDKILEICRSKNILLIEDSCESIGTRYMGRNVGNFGDISTFSFYYGHHMSTIEGGMVCTNDQELDQIVKSIRCHGWDRDLDEYKQKELRTSHNIDEFRALYTFYYPGFNMRCTDLQAFLGIEQMKKIDHIVSSRQRNFDMYVDIVSPSWGLDVSDHDVVSNFTFPVIARNVSNTVNLLKEAGVESRPLI
jgi:CDP-6-deoxy-D-xylo-4-hexulose-3-dehydrase